VREFVAKPQSLVDNKNKGLSTCLTNVRCCTGDNWYILFTTTFFRFVGGRHHKPFQYMKWAQSYNQEHKYPHGSQIRNEKRQDQNKQKKLKTNKNQKQNNDELTGGPQANDK
jgi:hypothetical protein